jgi:hypothetical protein
MVFDRLPGFQTAAAGKNDQSKTVIVKFIHKLRQFLFRPFQTAGSNILSKHTVGIVRATMISIPLFDLGEPGTKLGLLFNDQQ